LPSASNFLFVRPPQGKALALFEQLNEANILVRYWNKPLIAEWLRISIGTEEDMQALLAAVTSLD